ncbi:phytase [Pseudarthrobacter oxydans]|uniref:phytase n=2 Tax=Pseudarthrobacter oxydans TaxID=1671 RepID=UPI00343705DC
MDCASDGWSWAGRSPRRWPRHIEARIGTVMLRLFRVLAAAIVALAAVGAYTLINVFGSTAVAAPTTVTINPAADSYVSTASPNSNFGRAQTLAVSDTTYRALLRFNVSLPAGSTVTNVTLRLYSNTSVSGNLIVHPASNSWSETTVTANNQPAWQTAELARSGLLRSKQYASATLPTNSVTGSGSFSFGVDTTASVQGSLDSREGAKRPQLVITYDSPSTATPTPTPTSTAPGSAPQNIRVDPAYTTDLEHTARFLWDAVPNATIYRHYINGAAIAGEDDAGASETVRNLQPATAYTFSVGAFVGGVEYKSAPFSFTTAGASTTPTPTPTSTATPTPTPTSTAPGSAPQNIRVDPAYTTDLEHTARFLWDPVPNATNYRHYINGAAIAGEDDTSASETVRNLQPATAYTFSVGAFVGGVEYKSAPFRFTTAGASTTPTPTPTSTATPTPTTTTPGSAPQNIRVDPAYTTDLEHTARFLWDPVPNATNYRHYINGAAIAGEDDTSASETVRNLQPATAYTFSVGAFVGGVEYKSAPFSFTTAGPGSTPTSTATPTPSISTVLPVVENVGFSGSGDISDDAVIWADPASPANSVVIADNKSVSAGGIGVFGMDGKLIQFRQDGMLGNVDLRSGFVLSGQPIILVGANNRTNNTLVLYSFSATTRTLTPVTARSIPTVSPNIGFCLYHSRASGKFYAFVTPQQAGSVQQFELVDNGAGLVDAVLVRTLPMSSIAESCVADDELGHLYVGQETVAVWKYGAEPSAGSNRVSVDTAGSGRLVAEIEGMSISYGANGIGRLFVSSQGDSTIVVYDRAGNNPFVKKFRVGSNGTIDSVTGTDGLDVTTRNAGPGFEQGLLVVHDESNSGGTTSNLKYVPLSAVLG